MNAVADFIEPNTAQWFQAKCGSLGGSRIWNATKRRKDGEYSAERQKLMIAMLAERLTGRYTETYVSRAMQWGNDTEATAIAAYEMELGVEIKPIGWVDHPTIQWAGATPDGGIGEDGLAQFKCPETSTHVETLLTKEVDPMYYAQCQWELAVTGRDYNDFTSFDPRLPLKHQLCILRCMRDDKYIAELESEARKFLDELHELITKLESR